MVLGYATREASGYLGCHPDDLPILSTWGDRGLGAAALYVEVIARHGHIVETRWRERRLYLDLNGIPGDPREAVPGVQLERKGFVGWEWLISENDQTRRDAADVARLEREPGFAAFRREVTACIQSAGAPGCFAAYVKSPFNHPGAAAAFGTPHSVSAEQFVQYAWTAVGDRGGSGRTWTDLVSCFAGGRIITATATTARFKGTLYCDVERGPAGWKLTGFFAGG